MEDPNINIKNYNLNQKYNFNFNKYFRLFNFFSIFLIIVSILLLIFKGLNFGVDFKGGTIIELRANDKQITISQVRQSFLIMNLGDVTVKEFGDEIEGWVIDEFSKVGLDTAKSILELSQEDLIKRTDLEEETIHDVLRILKEEFED